MMWLGMVAMLLLKRDRLVVLAVMVVVGVMMVLVGVVMVGVVG